MNLVLAVASIVGSEALFGERWAENRGQSPAYVPAKGTTELASAMVWHKVALSTEIAAGDAVADRLQLRVVCCAPSIDVNGIFGLSLVSGQQVFT